MSRTTQHIAFVLLLAITCLLSVRNSFAQDYQPDTGDLTTTSQVFVIGAEVSTLHANPGATLTYTMTLKNTSPITPLMVAMSDTLPSDLDLLTTSVWSSQGTAHSTGDTITWGGQLAPSTTVTVGLAAIINRSNTVVTNTMIADVSQFGRFWSLPLVTTIEPWYTFLPLVLHNLSQCFFDDFSNPESGWPTEATSAWDLAYTPAGYRMYARQAPTLLAVTRGDRVNHERFDYEARVGNISDAGGAIGIVYKMSGNWTEFETVEINPMEQTYAAFHYIDGVWYERISGQLSTIAPHDVNTLRVEWDYSYPDIVYPSAQYSLYINGVRVYYNYYRVDNAPPPYGFGIIATSFTKSFTAVVEDYRLLPEDCYFAGPMKLDATGATLPTAETASTSDKKTVRPPLEILSRGDIGNCPSVAPTP